MNVPLSGEDIMRLMDGKIKVLPYSELSKFKTIDEVLEPYGRVALLYMSKPGFGHWVLLHKRKGNIIELFDSYGLCVDSELDFIDPDFRKKSNQMRQHLTNLMIQPKYTVHYNDKPIQSLKKGVSTCGRWALCRAVNNDLSVDKFIEKIKATAKRENKTPDQLVCELVEI